MRWLGYILVLFVVTAIKSERAKLFRLEDTNIKVIPGKDPLYTKQVWAEQNSMVYILSDGVIKNRFNFTKLSRIN